MTMREKNIKDKLLTIEVPKVNEEIKLAGKKEIEKLNINNRETLSFGKFTLEQLKFIDINSWLMQGIAIIFLVTVANILAGGTQDFFEFAIASAMTPIFLMVEISEFAKCYSYGMFELEAATKFSLKYLLTARLCIFGMIDIVFLVSWVALLHRMFDAKIYWIIFCTCVPFTIAALGMFLLLLLGSEENFLYKAGVTTVLDMFAFGAMALRTRTFYIAGKEIIWFVVLLVAIILLAVTIRKLIKKATCFA